MYLERCHGPVFTTNRPGKLLPHQRLAFGHWPVHQSMDSGSSMASTPEAYCSFSGTSGRGDGKATRDYLDSFLVIGRHLLRRCPSRRSIETCAIIRSSRRTGYRRQFCEWKALVAPNIRCYEPFACWLSTRLNQGAAAVLQFCAIESPFAQPRNTFFSQIFACLIGVGISKLFALNPAAESYTELGGALACGLTTMIMFLTNTVHPPAGATALLAVTQPQTVKLGWYLFPVMILGAVLMQSAALIINNIQRRFPLYWWTSRSLSTPKPSDIENFHRKESTISVPSHYEDSLTDAPRSLVVSREDIQVPDGLFLSAAERQVLKQISERI